MQRGDRHVDFETLLVHAGEKVALHLKQHVWFENSKNISHVHFAPPSGHSIHRN